MEQSVHTKTKAPARELTYLLTAILVCFTTSCTDNHARGSIGFSNILESLTLHLPEVAESVEKTIPKRKVFTGIPTGITPNYPVSSTKFQSSLPVRLQINLLTGTSANSYSSTSPIGTGVNGFVSGEFILENLFNRVSAGLQLYATTGMAERQASSVESTNNSFDFSEVVSIGNFGYGGGWLFTIP